MLHPGRQMRQEMRQRLAMINESQLDPGRMHTKGRALDVPPGSCYRHIWPESC